MKNLVFDKRTVLIENFPIIHDFNQICNVLRTVFDSAAEI